MTSNNLAGVSVSGNSTTATLVFTNSIMIVIVSVSGNSPTATLVFTNSIMVGR
ncbi:hypothetical protein J6590_094286 [Homalodisca vitripennis]|nr:hypothetical protein J6590_094281 [Homalodisca vitripennis]KAG8270030.1 hypothetical protein J6590_094286 [Homalodisca vitripennis]